MSVQFVIGRVGAGKSKTFLDRIISACKSQPLGDPIIWLVPRQATFQVERDLCCGPDLNGYFRVSVVSFESLCRQVLQETGGAAAADVSTSGRQMILGYLLRQHQNELKFFRSTDPHGGLTAELDATLIELASAGADLTTLSSRLAKTNDRALANKIGDLLRIHTAYSAFLGENRIDPDIRLEQAMQAIEHCPSIRKATIFVDSFLHFTARERRLLVTLARLCPQMHVALVLDPESEVLKNPHHLPEELSLFHQMEQEYRKLYFGFTQAAVKVLPPLILRDAPRFQSLALHRIESWIPGNPNEPADGLELIEAPDKRAEADAIARRVRDLVAKGFRYRDITVLARNLPDYQDLLLAAFGEHNIPSFVDQRRSAGHHPLIQFLRAAVAVASDQWPTDAMMSLIKTNLCGLTLAESDELENYCLLHGIRGQTWIDPNPWTGSHSSGDEDGLEQRASAASADLLRRKVVEPLQPFVLAVAGDGKLVRQICQALFALVEKYQVRSTLTQWIAKSRAAGQLEQAAEHEQVWTELLQLFAQLTDLLGEQVMTLSDFSGLLEAALDRFDLAITPQTVDQVLIGQVDRTRPTAVKAAIIVGLSDSQFPLPPPPEKVLSDTDRRTLSENSVDVEPDRRRRALDEIFLGYFAFTRPSHLLIATRPLALDRGRNLAPGSLWHKLREMIPTVPVSVAPPQDRLSPSDIATPRQLVSTLMQWARTISPENQIILPALYHWFSQRQQTGNTLDQLRTLAWPALDYTNTPTLPHDLAKKLFPAPLRATVRQLEMFRACPFQHFVRYGLSLSPRGEHGISQQDVSRLSRDVLDRVVRRMIRQNQDWVDLSPADLEDLVSEGGRRLKGELMLTSARTQYLLQWITRTLTQVVAAQKAVGARGQFRPAAAGVRYDEGADLPPLKIVIPGGGEMLIHGRIDRVDVKADGRVAVIYDYHLKTNPLPMSEVYHGLSLKLLTDLLAWQAANLSRPVAALDAGILRNIREANPEDAPAPGDEQFDLMVKPRGIIEDRFAGDLDSGLTPGKGSDAFNLYLNKEANFGNKSRTDVAESAELAGLLAHVRAELANIARDILQGIVTIEPYKLGNQTPCSFCAYTEICRFEKTHRYKRLPSMNRQEVFDKIRESGIGGA